MADLFRQIEADLDRMDTQSHADNLNGEGGDVEVNVESSLKNLRERFKADIDTANEKLFRCVEEEYGGDDPYSDYVDDKLDLCWQDEEFQKLVMSNWEDTMNDEIKLASRERQIIEEKGSARLQKAHKLARLALAAEVKYKVVFGGRWGMASVFDKD